MEKVKNEKDSLKERNCVYCTKLNQYRSKLRMLGTQYDDPTVEPFMQQVDAFQSHLDEYY